MSIAALVSILAACGSSPSAPGEVQSPSAVGALFSDDFESDSLAAWEDGVDPARHRIVTDSSARSGRRYLAVTYPRGHDGGWMTHFIRPGGDSLYASIDVRFPANWMGGTKLLGLYGSRSDDQWSAFGRAGICPSGFDFFAAMLVSEPASGIGTRFYTYYPTMAREPDGVTCWGRFGDGTERYTSPLTLSLGEWHHLEFWARLNTPGRADGEQAFWIDGTERGRWSGITFRQSAILQMNALQLSFSVSDGVSQAQQLHVDNVVVRRGPPSHNERTASLSTFSRVRANFSLWPFVTSE
jgi:hypothetical protein